MRRNALMAQLLFVTIAPALLVATLLSPCSQETSTSHSLGFSLSPLQPFQNLQVSFGSKGPILCCCSMVEALPPLPLEDDDDVAFKVVAGVSHTCALLKLNDNDGIKNQNLKCWGDNFFGQLGLEDSDARGGSSLYMGAELPPVKLTDNPGDDPGYAVVDVSLGDGFTCALLRIGSVKCWGSNEYGALAIGVEGLEEEEYFDGSVFQGPVTIGGEPDDMGDNLPIALILDEDPEKPEDHEDPVSSSSPKVIALESGNHHTCAIFSNQRVKCFGRNNEGQLGLGHRSDIGEDTRDLGKHLPYLEFIGDRSAGGDGYQKVAAVGLGREHTCVLFESKDFGCFGSNERGQLGIDDSYGSRGGRPGEMGNGFLLANLPDGKHVVNFALGYHHTCVILDTLELYCFGDNRYGQLVRGYQSEKEISPSDPTPSTLPFQVSQVATGIFHTCVMNIARSVFCVGWNAFGQLARGVTGSPLYEISSQDDADLFVDLGTDVAVQSISGKSIHTCAIIHQGDIAFSDEENDNESDNEVEGHVKCFGMNEGGRLGISVDEAVIHDSAEYLGDNLPRVLLTTSNTLAPTNAPTQSPSTATPTTKPTFAPSSSPTLPTAVPTHRPTLSPSSPTVAPTTAPTFSPTSPPPTDSPTSAPTTSPTSPTFSPTYSPTPAPTRSPIPSECQLHPGLGRGSCDARKKAGCPVYWVGKGCTCSQRDIRRGLCHPDSRPGRQRDGGCQLTGPDTPYCGFKCAERCMSRKACSWTRFVGCDFAEWYRPTGSESTKSPVSTHPKREDDIEVCSQTTDEETCEESGCTWYANLPPHWVNCRPECHFPGNRQNCEVQAGCVWENGNCIATRHASWWN